MIPNKCYGYGTERVRKAATPRRRKPTPLQAGQMGSVQKAKHKNLSIRRIDRELGIHIDTVNNYLAAESPPMAESRASSKVP